MVVQKWVGDSFKGDKPFSVVFPRPGPITVPGPILLPPQIHNNRPAFLKDKTIIYPFKKLRMFSFGVKRISFKSETGIFLTTPTGATLSRDLLPEELSAFRHCVKVQRSNHITVLDLHRANARVGNEACG